MSKFKTMFSVSLAYMGTAFASNILQGNSTYRRSLYDKLTGFNTSIHAEDLVLALSTQTELDVPRTQIWADIRNRDRDSIYCNQNLSCSNSSQDLLECCCTKKACGIGTFESILYVMKDSMIPPHVIHKDEQPSAITGVLTKLRPASIINHNLTKFPTIFEKKGSDGIDMKRFMNLEPFIPLCKLTNQFNNPIPSWGTKVDPFVYQASFCTLFRPTFTDQGICYAFNAKQPHLTLKPSSYLDAFFKVFGKIHSFGEDQFEPFNITGMGPSNGLTLYLDAHTLTGQYKIGKSQNKNFFLNFDHFNIFPLVGHGGVTVSAGQKTSIVLTPRVLESSVDVESLVHFHQSSFYDDSVKKLDCFIFLFILKLSSFFTWSSIVMW